MTFRPTYNRAIVRPMVENFNPSQWPGRKDRPKSVLISMDRPHGIRVVPAEIIALPDPSCIHPLSPVLAVGDLVLIEVGSGTEVAGGLVSVPIRVVCCAHDTGATPRSTLPVVPFRKRNVSIFDASQQSVGRGIVAMLVDGEPVGLNYGDRPSRPDDFLVVSLLPVAEAVSAGGLVLPGKTSYPGYDRVSWLGQEYGLAPGAGCTLGMDGVAQEIAVCLQDLLFTIGDRAVPPVPQDWSHLD